MRLHYTLIASGRTIGTLPQSRYTAQGTGGTAQTLLPADSPLATTRYELPLSQRPLLYGQEKGGPRAAARRSR